MGESTAIGWTDHTFNPWWGCTRVSPGCQHCYAETFSKRVGFSDTGSKVSLWGKDSERRFFGDKHWNEPRKWDRAAEKAGCRALVFCASMADVFEDPNPGLMDHLEEHRFRLFDLIEDTPHLTWQLLTKRPQNVSRMVPAGWICDEMAGQPPDAYGTWPSNCWVGTTAEDQKRADERIPYLVSLPAPVRFLSCEPLLGPVRLAETFDDDMGVEAIDWVICGGESGPGHRPLDLDAARTLRDECFEAGVPFFFKQVGGPTPTAGGDLLDGVQHKAFPS